MFFFALKKLIHFFPQETSSAQTDIYKESLNFDSVKFSFFTFLWAFLGGWWLRTFLSWFCQPTRNIFSTKCLYKGSLNFYYKQLFPSPFSNKSLLVAKCHRAFMIVFLTQKGHPQHKMSFKKIPDFLWLTTFFDKFLLA